MSKENLFTNFGRMDTSPQFLSVIFGACVVFAYGATGAGKTFTMVGRPECPGITLLTLMELYSRIAQLEADTSTSVEVAVSYLEVYNEMVRDLLQPASKPLMVSVNTTQHICNLCFEM